MATAAIRLPLCFGQADRVGGAPKVPRHTFGPSLMGEQGVIPGLGRGIVNTGNRMLNVAGRRRVPPRRAIRRSWSWLLRVALFLAPVLAFAASVQAQAPAAATATRQLPPKTFMSKNVFYLPVIIEERVRT